MKVLFKPKLDQMNSHPKDLFKFNIKNFIFNWKQITLKLKFWELFGRMMHCLRILIYFIFIPKLLD
jgi:hypothetical protein